MTPNLTTPDGPPSAVIDALWADLVAEVHRILRVVEAEERNAATTMSMTRPEEESHHAEYR